MTNKKKEEFDICQAMEFSLKQCETFCRIVELGSFSKAAEELHITQASASERVANLEKIIGVRLLDRLGRNIVPSSAGKMLYERAVKLLEFKKHACHELYEFLGVRRGEIVIGGSTIPGEFILPGVIGEFRKIYPEIRVKLIIGDTREITGKVIDGAMEFGIVGSKEKIPSISFEKLWGDELLFCTASNHHLALKKSIGIDDLMKEPFIIREAGSGTRRIIEKHLNDTFNRSLVDFNIVATLGSSTAVKEGIKSGLGVSILSKWSVESEIKSGSFLAIPIKNLKIQRSFYLVLDKRRDESPLCKALRSFIIENAKIRN